jgi:peroxiredoxin
MIVDDGVVTALALEEKTGQTAVSTAAQILEKL